MSENLNGFNLLVKGDRDTIKEIYSTMERKLGSWLAKNKGNANEARNILHEALTSIIISSHKKKINPPSNLEAYIFTICKYKWYDQLKSRKNKNEVINLEEIRHEGEDSIQDAYIKVESEALKHKVLDRSFSKLTDLCQRLLTLVKQGLKSKEIAIQLDMSSDASVNRRKFACMESWKKFLYADSDYQRIKSYD